MNRSITIVPIIICAILFVPTLLNAQILVPMQQNLNTKNNLVLEYDFSNANTYNGSGTAVNNLIGFSIPGVLYNSPAFFADPGYIQFKNASSQYLTFGGLASYYPAVSSTTRSGVFSVSLWFNPTNLNGVVMADLGTATINASYHTADIEMVNGYLKFSVWPKNSVITTSTTLTLNSWYHVVMVYDGAKLSAYLNGDLVGSATYARIGPHMNSLSNSSSSNNQQYFSMAAYDITNMGSGAYGSFLLSNFKFFSTGLSKEEVKANYLKEEPKYDLVFMLDAGNTASYPGSGTNWYDISGAAKTATNTAGVTYNSGVSGNLIYNGSAYTNFSFNLNSANTITVEMWAKPTNLTNGMFFGFYTYDVYCNNGALGYNTSAGDIYGLNATQTSGFVNNWKHYVFVMNSGSYSNNKIYINGVLQSLSQVQGAQSTTNTSFSNGVGRIASWTINTNYTLPIAVSIFKIYNRELTQTEINSKFNAGKIRHGL